jgi:hypothetical protein
MKALKKIPPWAWVLAAAGVVVAFLLRRNATASYGSENVSAVTAPYGTAPGNGAPTSNGEPAGQPRDGSQSPNSPTGPSANSWGGGRLIKVGGQDAIADPPFGRSGSRSDLRNQLMNIRNQLGGAGGLVFPGKRPPGLTLPVQPPSPN